MTTVFRVYAQKEDNFTVIIDDEGRRTRIYGTDEFAVLMVLKAAQCFAEQKPAMSLSAYKKQYGSK